MALKHSAECEFILLSGFLLLHMCVVVRGRPSEILYAYGVISDIHPNNIRAAQPGADMNNCCIYVVKINFPRELTAPNEIFKRNHYLFPKCWLYRVRDGATHLVERSIAQHKNEKWRQYVPFLLDGYNNDDRSFCSSSQVYVHLRLAFHWLGVFTLTSSKFNQNTNWIWF